MSELAGFSFEELEDELRRRELIADMPKLLEHPDFTKLQRLCQAYLVNLAKDEHDDDEDHFIFECAMESCFGRNVWDFINGLQG